MTDIYQEIVRIRVEGEEVALVTIVSAIGSTPREEEELGMVCGGDVEVFIEPILSPPTLYIFGGGHMSVPLAKIGKLVDFKIVVIDDRAEFANPRDSLKQN